MCLHGKFEDTHRMHAQALIILGCENLVWWRTRVIQRLTILGGPLCCLQVTSVTESATGPNTTVQGFVGLLGVLAVPIVGYSLYTLYNTGVRCIFTCETPFTRQLLHCVKYARSL